MNTSSHSNESPFHPPWVLFWSGFLARILYLTLAHTYRVPSYNDHFQFGWEMGRIARALVTGHGYADPFAGHTGPTAWVPPLYPLVLAGVFKTFGVYSILSGWAILAINSLFSAATSLFVYEIAARCYDRKVALWSGWLWALYPAAMQYAVRWIWDLSITTFLFAWVLLLALRMRGIGEPSRDKTPAPELGQWLLFGALWGLIGLSNSTLLLFMPVCGVWISVGVSSFKTVLRDAGLATLVFFICVAPWIWRNWISMHAFVPMRSNLGVELWAWNHSGANGIALGAPIQPSLRDPSFVPYAQMGEIAYSKYRGAIAQNWIRTHPMQFARLSGRRFYFYWVSVPHPVDKHPFVEYARELNYCIPSLTGVMGLFLSLKKRVPAAGLFAWAFLLLPLPYYFVSVAARFRHPLEPLITIFTVYLFRSAARRKDKRAFAVQVSSHHE